jgi:cytochrome b6-f complex iron-sulfur subunit
MSETDEKDGAHPTRRRFCQIAGLTACGLAAGGASAVLADFLRPRVLFEPPTTFVVGPPDAIAIGSVIENTAHRAYVIREKDGFRALTMVCTHLGCITRYQPDKKIIACPCHGSRFSLDGDVLHGPAPRPLPWLQMTESDKGELVVDTAVDVPAGTVYRF